MNRSEFHYGMVWWSSATKWHFPVEEPSRRRDLVECGNRIPLFGAVSWSGDEGAPRPKLMELCENCITERAVRFAARRIGRLEPHDAA